MTLLDDRTSSSPSRRGRRALVNVGWLGLGVVLTWGLLADPLGFLSLDSLRQRLLGEDPDAVQKAGERAQLWTCGMHPEVIQDEPGTCPICHMNLVPVEAEDSARPSAPQSSGLREVLFYRNPMDPTITSPVPAKDDMGMDYVPIYADEVGDAGRGGATVTIDPGVVQNMNVLTALAEKGDLAREIRTVGYLEYDQQKMVSVTTKYPGWIEKVFVNYVGEPVRKGQPLFEIYSPELLQTEQDLLSAIEFSQRMEKAPEDSQRRARALVEASRQRLAYWDVTQEQIERLEDTGRVFRTLTVVAPAGGVVMMRMPGLEGRAVQPGLELFHIANMSSLWLSVEAFENQIRWLRVGSAAEVSLSYFPGETFTGRVRFIEPQISEETRTVPLKLEVPNRDGRLRAGMYATVRFDPVVARDAVLVPTAAVLRTGQRNLVVVAEGEGHFTPREVQLGSEGDGRVEILSGLQAGERVVTSAQFLIDSESNLREAVQKLLTARSATAEAPSPTALRN